jgi:hypothetical protein
MYQSFIFFQEILFFFISYLLSFSENVKIIFLYMLYSNEDYISALDSPLKFVYRSFEAVNTYPFCIGDPEQDLNDNHRKSSELIDTKDYIPSSVLDYTLTKITGIYMHLELPSILHDFLANHYRCLPMFNGELEKISSEKHVQVFENFAYFFEIDHDDVLMRDFSQSLQGEIKDWFRHL